MIFVFITFLRIFEISLHLFDRPSNVEKEEFHSNDLYHSFRAMIKAQPDFFNYKLLDTRCVYRNRK